MENILTQRWHPVVLLRFDLIARVAILFACTFTALLGWFVPQSLTATMMIQGGAAGVVVMTVFTASIVLGYIDILLNDLGFGRPVWLLRHHHHHGYALIAALYLTQAFVTVGPTLGIDDLLPLGYLLNAFLAGWYAIATSVRGWHTKGFHD